MSDRERDIRELKTKQAMLDAAIAPLRGTFDAIIFIATWQTESGETATIQAADGNWHAQTGAMQYSLHKRMEDAACEKREQWAMDRAFQDRDEPDEDDEDDE